MTSSLTVLGGCGAWPEPGRACSGFVLEHEGYRIVLDLGYGTVSRLLAHLGSTAGHGVDAVLVSHAHPDHVVDLHGLFRARWYGDPGADPIPLIAPPGVWNYLERWETPDEWKLGQVFDWRTPRPGVGMRLGPFEVTCHQLPHHVENVGFRLDSSTVTVAYTGDTGPSADLLLLSRDADLLVADSTDRYQSSDHGEADNQLLTAAEAGRVARAATVKALMLTHFWPGNDREVARREAMQHFDGPVVTAEEGLRFDF